MKNSKIKIPAKKIMPNEQGVIKLTPEAMEALVEVVNESGRSMKMVASAIIYQAVKNDLIEFEREEE